MEGEYISIETAKRIAELEIELKEANEDITWWSNRFNAVEKCNKIANDKNIKFMLERDKEREIRNKAIEYIKSNEFIASDGEVCYFCNMKIIKDLLKILNGENNE